MKPNLKSKFKLFIITFTLFLLLFSSLSFATDSNDGIMPISEEEIEQRSDIRNSDLYVDDEIIDIKNTINGNLFASASTLNIDPRSNGGIITGNIFATANTVNIKSDIIYSETEKDELGNPSISVNNISSIYGNVFVTANKFILEPGCEINGDLYICANEIELGQNSIVYGNIFAIANTINLNCQVGGDLYATAKNFEMKYYGFIRRDLHLTSKSSSINGYVYRNSFISSDNIVLDDKFINEEDFNVEDGNNLTFCGEVKGNANINCKNITFNTDKDNCIIRGNLNYSSKEKLNLEDGVVLKEINYSNYKSIRSNSLLSNIWNYLLKLISLLVLVYVIYLLISKFLPECLNKLSNISGIDLLKCLGIGIALLVLIPIIIILLFLSHVASILGIILLLIYIIVMIIAKPIFIISIATFAKEKLPIKMNTYLYILIVATILSLISLIPYIGFIVSLLISFTGFGIIIKNLILNQK